MTVYFTNGDVKKYAGVKPDTVYKLEKAKNAEGILSNLYLMSNETDKSQ